MRRGFHLSLKLILLHTACLTCFFAAAPPSVFSQDLTQTQDAPQQKYSNQYIAKLIDQLADDEYQNRQRATRELSQAGAVAIEPLAIAATLSNNEICIRAFRILRNIALHSSSANAFAVEQRLHRLSDSNNQRVKRAAENALREIEPRIERAIGEHLESLGCQIEYSTVDHHGHQPKIYSIIVGQQYQGTKDDLLLLRRCQGIYEIEILSTVVDDELLRVIAERPKLTRLELENSNISNESLQILQNCQNLSALEFRYIPLDDPSIENLIKINQLSHLGLIGTRISDEGREQLIASFGGTIVDYRRGGFFGVRYNVSSGPCILTEVIPGTGADKAGLQVNDQIISFNGQEVKQGDDFKDAVSECFIGDEIEVELIRDGETIKLMATLGKWKM